MTTQISGDTGVSQVQDGVIVAADFQAALFAASLTGTGGYQKLPSGLIIQFGTIRLSTTVANTYVSGTVPLPIPFPNYLVSATATPRNAGLISNQAVSVAIYNDNNSEVIIQLLSAISAMDDVDITWIAIGY